MITAMPSVGALVLVVLVSVLVLGGVVAAALAPWRAERARRDARRHAEEFNAAGQRREAQRRRRGPRLG